MQENDMNEFKDPLGYSGYLAGIVKALMVTAPEKLTVEERNAFRQQFSKPVPPLPDKTPAIDLKEAPFSRFFRKSTYAKGYYFVRGTSCLWETRWQGHEVFLATLRVMRTFARESEEHWWAGPGHSIENIKREFKLLDGGFFSDIGNYMGPRGAWVYGANAIRLVCYELDDPLDHQYDCSVDGLASASIRSGFLVTTSIAIAKWNVSGGMQYTA